VHERPGCEICGGAAAGVAVVATRAADEHFFGVTACGDCGAQMCETGFLPSRDAVDAVCARLGALGSATVCLCCAGRPA
jgi:hypothetical protein